MVIDFTLLKEGSIIQGIFSKIKYVFEGVVRIEKESYVKIKSLEKNESYFINLNLVRKIFKEVQDEHCQ